MTARSTFKQTDVERAVKACEKAGLCVSRVRFTKDGFEIVTGDNENHDSTNWFAGSPLYRGAA